MPMECQSSDSKKLFKVFDASKRKRTRKKRDGIDDISAITDDSTSGCQANLRVVASAKASLQDVASAHGGDALQDRPNRVSSHSMSPRSPRRCRRIGRENVSLALKAGLVSTPRSVSPAQIDDCAMDPVPHDQESFIYAFLEDAIKRDKKKQRHARRQEERACLEERVSSATRDKHRRRKRDDGRAKEKDKVSKVAPEIDQTTLFETFTKFCKQLKLDNAPQENLKRTHSHKSLQYEAPAKPYGDQRPVRMRTHVEQSQENLPPCRIRSNEEFEILSRDKIQPESKSGQCNMCYNSKSQKKLEKLAPERHRIKNDDYDKYQDYYRDSAPVRSLEYTAFRRDRDYEDRRDPRERLHNEENKIYDQKNYRSYEAQKDIYPEDDRVSHRGKRNDGGKNKKYDDRRYEDREKPHRDRYYDEKPDFRDRHYSLTKEKCSKRNLERFERTSLASREEYNYRDRDRYSERERDSGLSVADGEMSTVSGKSNYLRVVKQEIAEQREAMDKMMKLWKELMRCFKGMSQSQTPDKNVQESAANARESAAAQLRLWRECMRRYETVARDVGDTDARLMEEINKQRNEMAEMASMWQECLQRYRDISNDFNSLKQQVTSSHVVSENPTRVTVPPIVQSAEGEGVVPHAPYRLPPNYPPPCPNNGYPGSQLRPRASAPPPAWWWCEDAHDVRNARDVRDAHDVRDVREARGARDVRETPRRRSSPESRTSRDRDHDRERRHRQKDARRDDSRYKVKSSKTHGSRSDQRHRKR